MFTNLAEGLTHDAPVKDNWADVILQAASYDETQKKTILTFKRSIYTGDSQDAAIRVSSNKSVSIKSEGI